MATITKRDLKKLRRQLDTAVATVKHEVNRLADFVSSVAGAGVDSFREVYLKKSPPPAPKVTRKPRAKSRHGSK